MNAHRQQPTGAEPGGRRRPRVRVPAAPAFTLSAAQTVTAEIQAQLGHSNAATTSRYIQHIAPQQLISTIRQRTWHAC